MLTISELAGLVGATPRTIRHYHRLGLLAEPPRRANGYRSYQPADLIRLTWIRRLRDLGLSLADITRLLAERDRAAQPPADQPGNHRPDGVRAALLALDEELARQQRQLERRRRDLAALLAGPVDVTLPPALGELLDRVAELGVDPADLAREREALTLAAALHPEQVPALAGFYASALAEGPDFMALTRRFAALADVPPDDPAVRQVADGFVDALRRVPGLPVDDGSGGPHAVFEAYLDETLSPAQRRCTGLIGEAFR